MHAGVGESGVLSPDAEKDNGPFPKKNRRVLIFSMGAANESHGPALPSNIDDCAGIATATAVALKLGLTYVGHLPYSSDRAGEVARDWNPGYIPMDELKRRVAEDVKRSSQVQESLGNKPALAIIIGAHGGNDFLGDVRDEMAAEIGMPFEYVRPFLGIAPIRSKKYGKIELTHADDGEHSVGLYLGLLDKRKLRRMNEIARKDPREALRQNPAIMGLGYYVLSDLSGQRYASLSNRHKELIDRASKFIVHDKRIIADYEVGKRLMEKSIKNACEQTKKIIDEWLR
jgi:creatinine amidohydrolase/Fe(II)-dependent formamide hydrolase-like protein